MHVSSRMMLRILVLAPGAKAITSSLQWSVPYQVWLHDAIQLYCSLNCNAGVQGDDVPDVAGTLFKTYQLLS